MMKKHNISPEELAYLVPHQANMRIIEAVARRMGISKEKVMVNIQKYGNTTAATIPLLWDEAVRTGRIRGGDLVLMVAFGAGLNWGALLLRA